MTFLFLQYNGINLRNASFDQAKQILNQAVENTVNVLVQYNLRSKYKLVR